MSGAGSDCEIAANQSFALTREAVTLVIEVFGGIPDLGCIIFLGAGVDIGT